MKNCLRKWESRTFAPKLCRIAESLRSLGFQWVVTCALLDPQYHRTRSVPSSAVFLLEIPGSGIGQPLRAEVRLDTQLRCLVGLVGRGSPLGTCQLFTPGTRPNLRLRIHQCSLWLLGHCPHAQQSAPSFLVLGCCSAVLHGVFR